MDTRLYKKILTQRGHTYSYYFVSATETAKPTILFLHGFPSTSHDWAAQVSYLSGQGYGIIAPDLLGYGGSSKPSDALEYNIVPMVKDVVAILDAEACSKVIAVGHDWGSFVASRLVNLYPERLFGVAFLAVGYAPPQPEFDYDKHSALTKSIVGYDVFGYWEYFAASDAPRQCEEHIDSFYSLLFPKDPLLWRTDLAPKGKVRAWIEQNRQEPLPAYWDEAARRVHQERLLEGGLTGPCNWYTGRLHGLNNDDESKIPKDRYKVPVPAFFGAALQDYICLAEGTKRMIAQYAEQLTVKDFNTSHWIPFEAPDELNHALDEFFSGL